MEIEQYNTICFKTANVPNFSEMEIEQNNYHLTIYYVIGQPYNLKEETFAIFGTIRESLFPRNICYL